MFRSIRLLTASSGLAQHVRVLALAAGLIYAFAVAGSLEGSLSWKHEVATRGVWASACAVAALLLWFRPRRIELPTIRGPIAIATGLLIGEQLIRAIVGNSWRAQEDLANMIALPLAVYLLIAIGASERVLSMSLVVAAAFCCLDGIYWSIQQGYRELALPLGNRPLMAGFLVLALGPAGGLIASAKDVPGRMIAGSLVIILCLGIIRTDSVAAVVAITTTSFLWILLQGLRRATVLTAAAIGAFVLLLGCQHADLSSLQRIGAVMRGNDDPILSWNNRARYWIGATPAIRDRMLTGYGSGQVGLVYPDDRLQSPGLAPRGEVVPDLHSTPLNWLFEFGLLGAGLRISVWGLLIATAWRHRGAFNRSSAVALFAYGIFSCFHYQLTNPAILWMIAGAAFLAVNGRQPGAGCNSRTAAIGLGSLTAIVTGLWARPVYANYLFESSKHQPAPQAVSSLLLAANADPRAGLYDFFAALRMASSDWSGLSPGKMSSIETFADEHFRRALSRYPLSSIINATYGNFLIKSRRPCDAAPVLEAAVALDFYHSMSHFDLANAYARCAEPRAAVEEGAVALLTNPSFAFASAWREDQSYLRSVIETALAWMRQWPRSARLDDQHTIEGLQAFLRQELSRLDEANPAVARLALSEAVGGELPDDPFAYVLQRRSIRFVTTEISLDAPATGSWAPEGIGTVRGLRALQSHSVISAYRSRAIASLVRSLGSPATDWP